MNQGNRLPTNPDGTKVDEEGKGVQHIDEVEDVTAGATKQLTVDLSPGNHVLLCNLPSHYKLGMTTGLTVGWADGSPCGWSTRFGILCSTRFGSSNLLTRLIIPLVIQTIRRDPSGPVWIDGAPNVSRADPSGADQIDAEHQATDLVVRDSDLA